MNGWLNQCQTALLGVVAAVTCLIMAGREAVQAFADMEEQLANTQKYTRIDVGYRLATTIMNIYKKPGEMAKKVRLDANQFIEIVKSE